MKTRFVLFLSFFLFFHYSNGQFNPLEIIDKVAGTLLPEVVDGVKSIKEANKKKEKDKEATELEENFKKEREKAIKEAKLKLILEIGNDIEYLEAIGLVQSQIESISNDVGRLSIFKDESFIEKLRRQQAVTVKNEIVRKFQNALEQVNTNMSDLRAARTKINTSSIPANARASGYLKSVIRKLDEINSSYNDCSKLSVSNAKVKNINDCLDAIRSVSYDIAELEGLVETLNTEVSSMLMTYVNNFKKTKAALTQTK